MPPEPPVPSVPPVPNDFYSSVVRAIQFTRDNISDVTAFLGFEPVQITTAEGPLDLGPGLKVWSGDWILRLPDGAVTVFAEELFRQFFVKSDPFKRIEAENKDDDLVERGRFAMWFRRLYHTEILWLVGANRWHGHPDADAMWNLWKSV